MAEDGSSGKRSSKEALKLLDVDSLVDEIIAKKGPHKYTDGLSEDNWEEVSIIIHKRSTRSHFFFLLQELQNIPLFMTKSPTVIDDEKAPGLAAIRDLKYETRYGRECCQCSGRESLMVTVATVFIPIAAPL